MHFCIFSFLFHNKGRCISIDSSEKWGELPKKKKNIVNVTFVFKWCALLITEYNVKCKI